MSIGSLQRYTICLMLDVFILQDALLISLLNIVELHEKNS